MAKKRVAVIFGGQSSEHLVSCMSAVNIMEQIDMLRYELLLIGITEKGHWLKADSLDQAGRESLCGLRRFVFRCVHG